MPAALATKIFYIFYTTKSRMPDSPASVNQPTNMAHNLATHS